MAIITVLGWWVWSQAQVTTFVGAGDRNTLQQGYSLCKRIEKLEQSKGVFYKESCEIRYQIPHLTEKEESQHEIQ